MITKDKVVAIKYVLTDKGGVILDETEGEPLEYLHGHRNLIPGIEKALEGHKEGDKFDAVIPPKDAYGEYDEELIIKVDRSVMGAGEPKVGMMARLLTDQGPMIARITEVNDKEVTFDANHEMAGKELHFAIEVVSVRPGTPEEIEAGSLHSGCGGSCGSCSGCH
ncbi:peptidylprolyl isomerase [bacterium]|nr:peptidylprolyl isomerase [bacterium]